MSGLYAYDLVAPARVLTPAFSPIRGHRPRRLILDEPPEDMVWVHIWWDGEYGCEQVMWEQWCEPDVPEYMNSELHAVPITQLAAWNAARAAYRLIEQEVEAAA